MAATGSWQGPLPPRLCAPLNTGFESKLPDGSGLDCALGPLRPRDRRSGAQRVGEGRPPRREVQGSRTRGPFSPQCPLPASRTAFSGSHPVVLSRSPCPDAFVESPPGLRHTASHTGPGRCPHNPPPRTLACRLPGEAPFPFSQQAQVFSWSLCLDHFPTAPSGRMPAPSPEAPQVKITAWGRNWISASPRASLVLLGPSLNLSKPQFPHL